MSHLYKNKIVKTPKTGTISQNGKVVGEKIKNMTEKEKAQFEKEA